MEMPLSIIGALLYIVRYFWQVWSFIAANKFKKINKQVAKLSARKV